MPTIQEILTDIRAQAAEAPTPELFAPVIEAVRVQEKVLLAFFPATNQAFITMENGIPTAVLFSNRDSFEEFAKRCKEMGMVVSAIEYSLEARKLLFASMYRCGFRQVMIDYAPQFVVLPLTAFMPVPDESEQPLIHRLTLNSKLNCKMFYLAQQIQCKRATGEIELDCLRELYHSVLLLPSQSFENGAMPAYHIPNVMKDGKRICYLYSDMPEYSRNGQVNKECKPLPVRFRQLQELLLKEIDLLVINPESGAPLTLDKQLLDVAEQAALGNAEGIGNASMQEERVTVTDPKEAPKALYDALTGVLTGQKDVRAAYLRVLKRDTVLRPSYLLLLDGKSSQTLLESLNKAAQPHLGTNDLEIIGCDKAPFWVGKSKPFFGKRKLN